MQGPSGTIRQPTDLIISGGAEVAMVVGLASGRISILEPIQTIHHATKDAKGLLQALHQVAQRLPLAQILSASPRAISMNTSCKELRGDDCKAMRAIVEECKNNVDNLKKVFQNVEAPPDASRVQHYRQVTRALGKGARVESLMKVILEDIQRWVENHGIRAVTNEQVKQLAKAIKEHSEIQPSLQEEDSAVNQTHSGTNVMPLNRHP